MVIKKLIEYKGASRFGTCTECGEMESDAHRLYRLQFRGVSVCLCPDCFRKTRAIMNDVILDEYVGKARSESQGSEVNK